MNQSFTVTGMTCGHCERAVARAVKGIDPKAEVTIDRHLNKVEVVSTCAPELISKAITDEGYIVVQ